jgi:Trypsin-like peptidase domain/Effector-associated domain 9
MDYFKAFKCSIARIFAVNNDVIGTGFLVSDRHLLTCAHVVAAALGLPSDTAVMPTELVEFDLPLLNAGQRVSGKVVFWQPVNPGQVGEDLAVLEVELGALPAGAQAVRLMVVDEPWEHKFRIFGFPEDGDDGIWASGVLREQQGAGWVQMEDLKAEGYAIKQGFSGAPVWDEMLGAVVGMAVAADRKQTEAKAAFMIPMGILNQVGAIQNLPIEQPKFVSVLSFVQQGRLTLAENSVKLLMEEFEAAHNQLNYTISEVDRVKLKRQIEFLSQELDQADHKFQQLKQKMGIE